MSLLSTRRKIKWRRGELIGEGAYARVYQAINVETGELVAIKHFKISDSPRKVEREFHNLRREIYLLRELSHPNIVQYYQTDLNEENYTVDLVMEYVSGGSLKRIVQKYRGLEETVVRKYAK